MKNTNQIKITLSSILFLLPLFLLCFASNGEAQSRRRTSAHARRARTTQALEVSSSPPPPSTPTASSPTDTTLKATKPSAPVSAAATGPATVEAPPSQARDTFRFALSAGGEFMWIDSSGSSSSYGSSYGQRNTTAISPHARIQTFIGMPILELAPNVDLELGLRSIVSVNGDEQVQRHHLAFALNGNGYRVELAVGGGSFHARNIKAIGDFSLQAIFGFYWGPVTLDFGYGLDLLMASPTSLPAQNLALTLGFRTN